MQVAVWLPFKPQRITLTLRPLQQDPPQDAPYIAKPARVAAVVHPWQADASGGVVRKRRLACQDVAYMPRHNLRLPMLSQQNLRTYMCPQVQSSPKPVAYLL